MHGGVGAVHEQKTLNLYADDTFSLLPKRNFNISLLALATCVEVRSI